MLQDRGDLSAIVGVAMIGLGVNAPVSIGLFGKLPCFILGECVLLYTELEVASLLCLPLKWLLHVCKYLMLVM